MVEIFIVRAHFRDLLRKRFGRQQFNYPQEFLHF